MNEVPQTPEEVEQWKKDREAEGAAPYASLHPPGSTHDSESQYTMSARIGHEQEIDPGPNAIGTVAGWEHANELLEPDTSRYESPVKQYDNCAYGHDPEVYCSGCRPTPELAKAEQDIRDLLSGDYEPADEVGVFDIGKPPPDAMRTLKDLHDARERAGDPFSHVTLDELRESPVYADKGPGFEGNKLDSGKPNFALFPAHVPKRCSMFPIRNTNTPNLVILRLNIDSDCVIQHWFACIFISSG